MTHRYCRAQPLSIGVSRYFTWKIQGGQTLLELGRRLPKKTSKPIQTVMISFSLIAKC